MPAASLDHLQRQIADRERELQALREELESRRSHLAELTRRKEELQNHLQEVEAEIVALSEVGPATRKGSGQATRPAAAAPVPAAGQPDLRDIIETILRERGRPMTARQIAEEANLRGCQVPGRDPAITIKDRLKGMRARGIVRKVRGRGGFALARPATAPKGKSATPKPTRPEPATPKSRNGSPAPQSVKATAPVPQGKQPPLREVLTAILKKSRKPLTGSELAEQALAAGYKSKGKNFVDNVWAILGLMDNVEHLPGKGYRLKKD